MSAPKVITVIGFQGKVEASYNAGGTTASATDGIQLADYMDLVPKYANVGDRPAPPGTRGTQRRALPTGRSYSGTAKVEPRGFGAAYSASNKPNVSTMMRVSGHDETIVTTGGSESVAYTPTAGPTTFASLVADFFARGEQYHVTGGYSDFNFGFQKAGDVPVFEFPLMGLGATAIADAAVPNITYPVGAEPPIASGILFTLGLLTAAKVRKLSFKQQLKIVERLDANGTTHGGFGPARRSPIIEVTLEALPSTTTPFLAASAADFFALFEAGTPNALSFQFGTTQYKRIKFSAPAVQIMAEPKLDKEEHAALVTLSLQLNPSAQNTNDEYSVKFD